MYQLWRYFCFFEQKDDASSFDMLIETSTLLLEGGKCNFGTSTAIPYMCEQPAGTAALLAEF